MRAAATAAAFGDIDRDTRSAADPAASGGHSFGVSRLTAPSASSIVVQSDGLRSVSTPGSWTDGTRSDDEI